MTERKTVHGSFTVERKLSAPPARVFAAFADVDKKAKWFAGGGDWKLDVREMDFRVGGRERVRGKLPNGKVSDFDATYHDIVADRRIVYSYVMHLDEKKISVSLATIDVERDGTGTRLVVTEHGAFLDGYDDAGSREHGTNYLMDKLVASLGT